MTTPTDLLLTGWQQNLDQAEALLRDVPAERLAEQPPGVINHPAWTLAHLIHYHPAILNVALGRAVRNPAEHPDASRYDEGSRPLPDLAQYPAREQLLADYRAGHDRVIQVLQDAEPGRFEQPPGLARWHEVFHTSAATLTYLMITHEANHLGQVMVWRRAMGWPALG